MGWKELDLTYYQLADEIVTACYTNLSLILASYGRFMERRPTPPSSPDLSIRSISLANPFRKCKQGRTLISRLRPCYFCLQPVLATFCDAFQATH